ncbi:MAG: CDP-alcohol phosphatidyltransferase family protein [Micromonosporaceae bacterium]|jgi:CDP-diacylglycerol--glycerol-3-phosphate 3-phosphatidyltransferase|nr:CDP-alcohol phosphatidyltransferase family protein [Micromonosporaceae bacterium]
MAKIFSVDARAAVAHVIDPVARALLRAGVSPNAVTVAGTVGAVAAAIGFGSQGHFVAGALVVTLFAFTDLIDGTMARLRDSTGSRRFGALLDSTMDRIADGAIFGTIVYWFAKQGDEPTVVAGLICLVSGQIVSYVKARAEGLGMGANVGIAERPERLVLVGLGAVVSGAGLDWGLPAALWLLAVLSVVTVGQRVVHVYRLDAKREG